MKVPHLLLLVLRQEVKRDVQRLKGSDVCLGFFSLFMGSLPLHPKFPLNTSSEICTGRKPNTDPPPPRKPHLTSNVCFKDRCIDIDIKVHPLLQHVDNSLELRNISQDLQGNRDSGLEFMKEQRAAQYLGLILAGFTTLLNQVSSCFQKLFSPHFRSLLWRVSGKGCSATPPRGDAKGNGKSSGQ